MLLIALLALGCSKAPFVWAADVPAERAAPEEASKLLQGGDIISVSVLGQEEMSARHTVGADGTILLPSVGAVAIAGKTAKEAEAVLVSRLATVLEEPRVSVLVISRQIEIGILGEVTSPGKYQLRNGDGVAAAIAVAGGLTEFGNANGIYLIRESEPRRIRFRMQELLLGGNSARAFALRDGDIVFVE